MTALALVVMVISVSTAFNLGQRAAALRENQQRRLDDIAAFLKQ